jgi:MerR family regulatory protein
VNVSGSGQPLPAQHAITSKPGAAYKLGEVATQTGLSPKQLRQWELRGLVAPMHGPGGQRRATGESRCSTRAAGGAR